MRNIIFHPDIEQEVKASYEWYQHQAIGEKENKYSTEPQV